MSSKVTVFFTVLLAVVVMASATDKIQKAGSIKTAVAQKVKVKPFIPMEPDHVSNATSQIQLNKPLGVRKTAASSLRAVGNSSHGYGWGNTLSRAVDRFAGEDADGAGPIDYLLMGHRGTQTDGSNVGVDMVAVEIDLSTGLANGSLTNYTGAASLNAGMEGPGARYVSVVALERPMVTFSQYRAPGQLGAPLCHPYLVTEYTTYGPSAGAWTIPGFQMDAGWLDPTVAGFITDQENRFLAGSTSMVQDATGIFHYVGVYGNVYSDTEMNNDPSLSRSQTFIFTATSVDNYPANGWTLCQDVPNGPTKIDTNEVVTYTEGVHMNASGFGAIAGHGYIKGPGSDDTQIVYSTTTDYGVTWADWDSVGLEALGFDTYITADEKVMYFTINPPADTVWYEGPAFHSITDIGAPLVDENNNTYIVFGHAWGVPGEEEGSFYASYQYSGVFLAKRTATGEWGAARIAYNNGIWVGDDDLGGSAYFWAPEPQITMDDGGNLYVAWFDRRRTETQYTRFNRYGDPETYGDLSTYKADIYAAHSIDGGQNWTAQINITDSPSTDEIEINLALNARNQDTAIEGDYGKIWLGYSVADTSSADPATDASIELPQTIWAAEADGFNNPSAVDEQDGQLAEEFALHQNYPNPFNPATRIEVVPVRSGHATLTVYSLTGQKIQTLFDGQLVKGQPLNVDFDGTNVAAGVYFYSLRSGDKVEVKKMALIK